MSLACKFKMKIPQKGPLNLLLDGSCQDIWTWEHLYIGRALWHCANQSSTSSWIKKEEYFLGWRNQWFCRFPQLCLYKRAYEVKNIFVFLSCNIIYFGFIYPPWSLMWGRWRGRCITAMPRLVRFFYSVLSRSWSASTETQKLVYSLNLKS